MIYDKEAPHWRRVSRFKINPAHGIHARNNIDQISYEDDQEEGGNNVEEWCSYFTKQWNK